MKFRRNRAASFLLTLGVISDFFVKGAALICYYCDDTVGTDSQNCSDPFNPGGPGIERHVCFEGFTRCFKSKVYFMGYEYFVRGCYNTTRQQGCYENEARFSTECFCTDNYCNSAISDIKKRFREVVGVCSVSVALIFMLKS